jgi:YVTN family beta-propeller protein
MRTIYIICLLICGSLLLTVHAQEVSPGYKIVNKINLNGDEKWDYLFSDDAAGRLYVSHGDRVHVVDQSTGAELGTITGLEGVHGIAIAPEFNKGFISTKNDNMVTIFDTKTFKVIEKIEAEGKSPDAILFDPFSRKVFVCNGHSNNATVLDPKTDKIVATIAFSGNPEFSVTDDKGKIYINLEDASKLAVVNATSYKVENEWPLAPGEEPSGLALDNENHRLFSVCSNNFMVVTDAISGRIITTLPIGNKPDGAGFDPGLKRAYSSNGEGTLTIVQENANGKFSVLENLPTQKGAKTMTVNKLTHHIYSSSADFETLKDGNKQSLVPGSFKVLDILPQ